MAKPLEYGQIVESRGIKKDAWRIHPCAEFSIYCNQWRRDPKDRQK